MTPSTIVPCLWFDHQAEEAARFYASVIPNSGIETVQTAPGDYPSGKAGDVLMVELTIGGLRVTALNGGPYFKFNEAISLQIEVEDQAEMDRLYDALSAVPEAEQCGWLKDRYGLSWQLVPRPFMALMKDPDPAVRSRVFESMMHMKRLDIAALEAAARADGWTPATGLVIVRVPEARSRAMPDEKPRRRFPHKLYLVLLDKRDGPAVRDGRSLWALQRPMTYWSGAGLDERITVPAGFVTDLASVPRLVWSFYPPDGPWVKAAVVHDFLYDTQGDGRWNTSVGVDRVPPYSRAEADGVLREGMDALHIGAWERTVIWLAVRLGGRRGWDRAGELRARRQRMGKSAVPRRLAAVDATPTPLESRPDPDG